MKKKIQIMTAAEFAEHLLTLGINETVDFACGPGCDWPNEEPTSHTCEDWYFAKHMYLSEYQSNFILIDYCGGEEAFAIPLNCYKTTADEEDHTICKREVQKFFDRCDKIGPDQIVFVEVPEEFTREEIDLLWEKMADNLWEYDLKKLATTLPVRPTDVQAFLRKFAEEMSSRFEKVCGPFCANHTFSDLWEKHKREYNTPDNFWEFYRSHKYLLEKL